MEHLDSHIDRLSRRIRQLMDYGEALRKRDSELHQDKDQQQALLDELKSDYGEALRKTDSELHQDKDQQQALLDELESEITHLGGLESATSESSGGDSRTRVISHAYGIGVTLEGWSQLMETREAARATDKTDAVTPTENPALDLPDLIQTMPVIELCEDNSVDCIGPTGSLEELQQINWWEVLVRKDAGKFHAKPASRVRRDFQQLYEVCGRTSAACSQFDLRNEAILYDYGYKSHAVF